MHCLAAVWTAARRATCRCCCPWPCFSHSHPSHSTPVPLPPRPSARFLAVVLSEREQAMYKAAHAASKAVYAQYRANDNAFINKHLLQIMALLLPMRRVCSGAGRRVGR